MKITVFTSNQPRHVSLIESLASIADQVFAVQECNTIFPGKVADFFNKSATMQEYFNHVISAEQQVFGNVKFTSNNVTQLAVKMGDLNRIDLSILEPALQSDYYVVFGASYIKGDLIDYLTQQKAINIHMGLSPYYRGSSCNFWALYDGHPEMVGATIHMLSKGLDSGDMLFHALPSEETDAFVLGMKAVKSAHEGLVKYLSNGDITHMTPVPQNRALEIRYTKNREFTDEIARAYLDNMPDRVFLHQKLSSRDTSHLLHPYIAEF